MTISRLTKDQNSLNNLPGKAKVPLAVMLQLGKSFGMVRPEIRLWLGKSSDGPVAIGQFVIAAIHAASSKRS